MLPVLIRLVVFVGSMVLWFAGLRLFLYSQQSRARKVGWGIFLCIVGAAIGVILPLTQIWSKFLLLVVGLPVLAAADVWLLRSGRGLSFWVRACGFEVCTVFGVAGAARYLLDLAGVPVFLRPIG